MAHAKQRSHDRYATSLETVLRRDEKHLEAYRHGQIGLKLVNFNQSLKAYQIVLVKAICSERYSAQSRPMSSLAERKLGPDLPVTLMLGLPHDLLRVLGNSNPFIVPALLDGTGR